MRLVALLLALLPSTAWSDPPALYRSRVEYAPLVKKLAEAHGSPADVLHPAAASDLAQLASGKRYKMILDGAGKLAIAPLPADAPHNEYVHPILAGGAAVQSAGGITVEQAGGKIARVSLDQDSKSYCPAFASLQPVAEALVKLGVPRPAIALVDRSPGCAPAQGQR